MLVTSENKTNYHHHNNLVRTLVCDQIHGGLSDQICPGLAPCSRDVRE